MAPVVQPPSPLRCAIPSPYPPGLGRVCGVRRIRCCWAAAGQGRFCGWSAGVARGLFALVGAGLCVEASAAFLGRAWRAAEGWSGGAVALKGIQEVPLQPSVDGWGGGTP